MKGSTLSPTGSSPVTIIARPQCVGLIYRACLENLAKLILAILHGWASS